MNRVMSTCILAAAMCISAEPSVFAQDERVRLSGHVAGAVGDGGPAPAVSLAGGFQLAPHAGFEIELLYIPNQEFDRSRIVLPAIFPAPRVDIDGRTVAFLSSFVADLETGRLRPYAQFGGGIANVERKVQVSYAPGILSSSSWMVSFTDGISMTSQRIVPIPRPFVSFVSENDLILTAGAGLDVRVWKRLSVAGDVRYLHVFDTQREPGELEHITRLGARVSCWF